MKDILLAAIQDRTWLQQFQRGQYAGACASYIERYGPAYAAAAAEGDLSHLAEALMDALEAGWRSCSFWQRSTRQMEEKQMVVVYLTPMLLAKPETAPLAELLAQTWRSRHPKDGYQIATQEEINAGFRYAIFGFELPKKEGKGQKKI